MLALPHQHHNMAPAPLPPAKGMHRTVRGAALAVVGNSWTITNTAPLPSFEAAPISSPISPPVSPPVLPCVSPISPPNTAPLPSFEAATPNPNPNPYTPTLTLTLTLTLTFEP